MEAIGEEANDGETNHDGGANHVELDDGAHEVNGDEVAVGEGGEEEGPREVNVGEIDFEDVGGPTDRDDALSKTNALVTHLRSSGYDEEDVWLIAHSGLSLMYGILKLEQWGKGAIEDGVATVSITAGDFDSEFVLLPSGWNEVRHWWEQFVRKLSCASANDSGYVNMCLGHIQLGSDLVRDTLLPVLEKGAPIESLLLLQNDLESDSDGMKFVLDAIRAIATLDVLTFDSNPLQPEDVPSLIEAVIDHPRLDSLALKRCQMGRESEHISTAIARALENVREIGLSGNKLGSHSVKLISACLAKNPIVESLYLTDNMLGDNEAVMLAWALQFNVNLRTLRLKGNQITHKGWFVLKRVLFNSTSMDHISQQLTCFIDSGDDTLSMINNRFLDPDKNRRLKLGRCLPVAALKSADVLHVMVNIRDIPIGVVPNIIVFVQGLESIYTVKGLDATFRLMCQWNMPLLFTSTAGPCPRRSNRIRARKVSLLMGK